jgi:transposase-like protein
MAAMAKLEAAQLHSWVDQLQSENQLLRRQLEDAMLSAASAGAEAKRRLGLVHNPGEMLE